MADSAGCEWWCDRLDVVVDIRPDQRAVRVEGEMRLTLQVGSSTGPSIAVNPDQPVMRFEEVTVDGDRDVDVELNAPLPDPPDPLGAGARVAHIRAGPAAFRRGDQLTLRFVLTSTDESVQFLVREGFALASWTQQWLPGVLPRAGEGPGAWMQSRGRTTFRLPPGWRAVSNGVLVEHAETGTGTTEAWHTDQRVGRSFAAGPYRSTWHEVDGRRIGVHLLSEQPLDVDQQLAMLAGALAAQEARFGPYPYPTYSVVEVPDDGVRWYASSEQGFILAVAKAFSFAHGNLPLWAHEMAHGWWGNRVMTDGPGSLLCDESLAQYSAVVAIETVEGAAAAREFLDFSRTGYSPLQCARGYFELAGRGEDMPLSAMRGEQLWEHHLSDAKGHWVYHMLRQRVGDDRFFATLRGLLDSFTGRSMRLDDVRAAFAAAAPDCDLETFFAQWLDRPGAPECDLVWTAGPDRTEVVIRQVQPGEPYALALELAVDTAGGRVVHPVDAHQRETRLVLPTPGDDVQRVVLDPEHRVLMWRPEYHRPAAAGLATSRMRAGTDGS